MDDPLRDDSPSHRERPSANGERRGGAAHRSPATYDPTETVRRRVLGFGLPLGILAAALVWTFERADGVIHAVDLVGLPLLATVLGVVLVAVWRGLPIEPLERTVFVAFSAFLVASMSANFLQAVVRGDPVRDLGGAGYWFPVLYAFAYLIWGAGRGRTVALLGFAVLIGLGGVFVTVSPAEAVAAEGLWLVQIFASNALVLLLLSVFAVLTETRAEQAVTDPLTGLGNRRRFELRLAALAGERGRRRRGGPPFALLLLDLDHFKRVNDAHGHAVGDAVLREAARLLRDHLRASDTLVRWGGEEFAVLAPGHDRRAAERLGERLRGAVADHDFGAAGTLTVSVGVAVAVAGETSTGIYHRADAALYRAKDAGRDRVEIG